MSPRLGRRRCRNLLDSIAGSRGCRLGTRRNPTARYRRLPADRIRTRHDRPPTPSPGAPIRAESKRGTWNLVGIVCLSVLVLARSGRSFVRRECELLPMIRSSFPRRQQYRRLRRAAASGAAGLATGACAVGAASVALEVAGVLLLVTSGLLIDARRSLRLAARSRIGARSEDDVRRALAALER